VLNGAPSSSRTSRRMTLSRVVVLPANVRRLTKYCSPSVMRIVTLTVGSAGSGDRPLGRRDRLEVRGNR
jgi:hypothetical protein